jgi:TRAP-type C4-dicarboxylate transport system substrate-binding protein
MNKNLEDLMYQSGLTAQGCWDSLDEYDRTAIEKFAELIVKECANVAAEHNALDIYEEIREHFGVEEQVQDSKELHTCPYLEEIYNDYESLCDCDEEQQRQCAMDI